MNGRFGNDVGVQTVAEVNGINVVAGARSVNIQLQQSRKREHPPSPLTVIDFTQANHSPFQITVHDREKDLKEQIDGIYQHRQQIQPSFTSHFEAVFRRPVAMIRKKTLGLSALCSWSKILDVDGARRCVRWTVGLGRVVAGYRGRLDAES